MKDPTRGLFDFSMQSPSRGGNSDKLLKAVLQYSQILPKHCTWLPSTRWSSVDSSEKMFSKLAPLIQRNSGYDDSMLRIFFSGNSNSNDVHIDSLKDMIDKVKDVHDSAPLLGGMVGIKRIDGGASNDQNHRSHVIAFTMCEGEPVICTWGSCDDTYNWRKLRITQTHMHWILLLFGAINNHGNVLRAPPKKTLSFTHLVLRDPRNTVNVHVKIDTFKRVIPETSEKHAQIRGTVEDVKYEFAAPELQSHDQIPKKGTNISIDLLGSRWYRINRSIGFNYHSIRFATDSFYKTIGPSVAAYIGDISNDRLKNLMQSFVFFCNQENDTLLVLEPTIKKNICTHAFIQNSKHPDFSIGGEVDLKPLKWHDGQMMYGITSTRTHSITFYTSKKSHYYVSQNFGMLRDIEKIDNMFNSTEWNEEDMKYIQDIRERCQEGLKQLIVWIKKQPIEEFFLEFEKEKEIQKLKNLQTAFYNLSLISSPYEKIPNSFLVGSAKYDAAFVDVLGLVNTLNTPSIANAVAYYTHAINVPNTMETVDEFVNILRDIITSHGKRLRKRTMQDAQTSSTSAPKRKS